MRLGIIDVGTNSLHLVIGTPRAGRGFRLLHKERHLARLGDRGLASNRLAPEAMRRAMEMLGRYASTLRRFKVDHIEAVATSAVRDAGNGAEFVRRVRARTGLPLRIISGREEARLIYLGILQTRQLTKPTVIVTIGGGSAQVIMGDGGVRPRYLTSVPLGGARLAQRFLKHDPARPEELGQMTVHVRRAWTPVARAVSRFRWKQAFGASATIEQLIVAAALRTSRRAKHRSAIWLTRKALEEFVDWLADSTAKERIRLEGLDPDREDLALPTAVTLLVWMEACGVKRLAHSRGSLREGLVLDYLLKLY